MFNVRITEKEYKVQQFPEYFIRKGIRIAILADNLDFGDTKHHGHQS